MKNLKSLLTPLFFLGIVATGCQKDELKSPGTENATDFRTTVLSMVYGLSGDQLNDPDILRMYDEQMASLTGQQRAQLEEIVENYTAQGSTLPNEGALNFRSGSETILTAGANGDYFGNGIAKSGNTLFVGAPGEGKVYVYVNNNLSQTLTGPGLFGGMVASSGNWLAVSGGTNPNGVVVLFKKQGNSWVENATINPGFQFFALGTGTDIAMHGNTLAVMGRNLSISNVQVYKLAGNSWSLETTLEDGDTFWWDMDIHANTIVMNGGLNIGLGVLFNPKVYIYEESGLTTVPLPQPGNLLARWVAIHNSTIVANAMLNLSQSHVITPSSGTWAISGVLVNPFQGSTGFSQGRRLAIQGSKAVVTFPATASQDPNDKAFVFEQSESVWNLTETLTPSTGGTNLEYGYRALVNGNQVTIGAPGSATAPGSVFIYE